MKIEMDIDQKYEELTLIIHAPALTDEINELISTLKPSKNTTLAGMIDQKIYVIDPKDILLFYSEDSKVLADTQESTYELKQKLYELEETFQHQGFVRISKSAIANVKKIKSIELYFNGSLMVKFPNSRQEIISRRYVNQVKSFIGLGGKQ